MPSLIGERKLIASWVSRLCEETIGQHLPGCDSPNLLLTDCKMCSGPERIFFIEAYIDINVEQASLERKYQAKL